MRAQGNEITTTRTGLQALPGARISPADPDFHRDVPFFIGLLGIAYLVSIGLLVWLMRRSRGVLAGTLDDESVDSPLSTRRGPPDDSDSPARLQ